MRGRHVQVEGSAITFKFKGKSGVMHTIDLQDRRMAKIIRRCLDLPGYELFQYLDNEDCQHAIDSADVNDYLFRITGQPFTAKDFRTWAGTVLTCRILGEFESFDSPAQAKRNVVRAIEAVAARLGNTPSVCRKCYVHPAVLDCYLNGNMMANVERCIGEELAGDPAAFKEDEVQLLKLLEQKVKTAAA
jgi:DNA topoisomerase-1